MVEEGVVMRFQCRKSFLPFKDQSTVLTGHSFFIANTHESLTLFSHSLCCTKICEQIAEQSRAMSQEQICSDSCLQWSRNAYALKRFLSASNTWDIIAPHDIKFPNMRRPSNINNFILLLHFSRTYTSIFKQQMSFKHHQSRFIVRQYRPVAQQTS